MSGTATMRAVVFDRFGEPVEVLDVRDVPIPEPGPGEVRVRMIAAPVNPSDLLVVRGRYGVLPRLPATPGFEGVGVVDAVGPGAQGRIVLAASGVRRGTRVAAINDRGGNWAQYAVIAARLARPVPSAVSDEQAASFFVNPATAVALVRHVLRVPRDGWLLQSAANSSLGRMIIRLCKHDGIRTINVVRRGEVVNELTALGADAVIVNSDGAIAEEVARIAGSSGAVRHAIDPVGGAVGSGLLGSLGSGGRLVVYGSLSEEPLSVPNRSLIAGDRVIQGFWLGHWIRGRTIPQNLMLFKALARLIEQGVLDSRLRAAMGLDEVVAAVRLSESPGEAGKVLLRMP